MKHIFIVNPKSGKCDNSEYIKSQLEGSGFDFEVYTTKAPLDAVEFIKQWCTSNDEEVRFYACGGDRPNIFALQHYSKLSVSQASYAVRSE